MAEGCLDYFEIPSDCLMVFKMEDEQVVDLVEVKRNCRAGGAAASLRFG